jgi:hypothetical protein
MVELNGKKIDLFLFACNHEKRIYCAHNKLRYSNNITNTIAFCYKSVAKNKQVETIQYLKINNHLEVFKLLEKEFAKFVEHEEVNLIIDYSCMTKSWYYSIILFLSKRKLGLSKINAYFIYTPSKFSAPKKPKYNTDIAPLPGKYVVPTNKPKALIVCLGYEQNKAEGIIDHLDPKICYIFYTKPALDNDFVKTVEVNNKNILDHYKNVITYRFDDLLFLERQLTSIYYLLKDDYSIIIAPLGPKPFTFISMLMSIKFHDIDIWRIGSGSDINQYKREPINDDSFIVSEVVFEA